MKLLKKILPFFKKRRTTREEGCSDRDEEDSSHQTLPLSHSEHSCSDMSILRAGREEGAIRFTQEGENLTADGAAASVLQRQQTTAALYAATDESESVPPLFVAIQTGDIRSMQRILERPEAANSPRYSGLLPLHAACYVKNLPALTLLLERGAKVEGLNKMGHTALHLAVSEGWHVGVAALLGRGASPDAMSGPPSTVRGVRKETPLHAAVRLGDLTSTDLLLQYHPDLALKDEDDCSILHLAAQGRSLGIVRKLLREKLGHEVMTEGDSDGNSVLHKVLLKACDASDESAIREIVEELINAGADANCSNKRGESPLFLAALQKLPKLVELLLSSGADPSGTTGRGQSVLHAACQHGSAPCLEHLLGTGRVGRLVTAQDAEGRDPFHYAVLSGSIDCCELLINNGDHLTRVDKDRASRCSLILEHLPSATQLLRRLFDAHVRLSNKPHYDADFRVTFDYSVLYSETDGMQSSLISELTTSRLEALLKHPLLESFLYIKWRKIKPFFYFSVLIYFVFLLTHTTFIVLTFSGRPRRWHDDSRSLAIFLVLHICMFLLILVPDLIIMFANFKKYLRQWETLTKAVALSSSAIVVFSSFMSTGSCESAMAGNATADGKAPEGPSSDCAEMSFIRNSAAVSAFFCWVEFMMLLGRFPSLGTYVLMFTRVAKSIIKFTVAFSSLIVGFAVSFMVLFHDKSAFSNLPLSLVKTLMMMIGEIEYGDLMEGSGILPMRCLFLVLFLFLVCVLMANLLIGLAVNDIPDLQRQGKIKRLSKQASYLVSYERLMVIARDLGCFPRQLRVLMTGRCRIPQVVTVLPNRDNQSRMRDRHHHRVPSETLQEAILLGNCEDPKEEFNNIEEEDDLVAQFKSFKVKYVRDRKLVTRRLAQLPDSSTTEKILKERFDHMQQVMQTQLMNVLLQIQQQQQQQCPSEHHFRHQQQLPSAQQQQGQPQQSLFQQSIQEQLRLQQSTQPQSATQVCLQRHSVPVQRPQPQSSCFQAVQTQFIPEQPVPAQFMPQQFPQSDQTPHVPAVCSTTDGVCSVTDEASIACSTTDGASTVCSTIDGASAVVQPQTMPQQWSATDEALTVFNHR